MSLSKAVLAICFLQPSILLAATAEQEAEVKRFLQCIEDDYRRKTATPQNHKMSAKELEALFAKPMAALVRLSESAQNNSKSFENEIPKICKPILEDLARKAQSAKP